MRAMMRAMRFFEQGDDGSANRPGQCGNDKNKCHGDPEFRTLVKDFVVSVQFGRGVVNDVGNIFRRFDYGILSGVNNFFAWGCCFYCHVCTLVFQIFNCGLNVGSLNA